jgi:hypothetical protein
MPGRLLITFMFLCLSAATVWAQTSVQLRRKYGDPVAGKFLVRRPEITASQSYSKQLHLCIVHLESSHAATGSRKEVVLLSPQMAEEIILEMTSLEKRGKYGGTYDAECGRSGEITSIYENVFIVRHTLGINRWYSYVDLRWKASACK